MIDGAGGSSGYIPNCRWLVKTPARADSRGRPNSRPNSRRDHNQNEVRQSEMRPKQQHNSIWG
jgi:hypothetical protein